MASSNSANSTSTTLPLQLHNYCFFKKKNLLRAVPLPLLKKRTCPPPEPLPNKKKLPAQTPLLPQPQLLQAILIPLMKWTLVLELFFIITFSCRDL